MGAEEGMRVCKDVMKKGLLLMAIGRPYIPEK